jgi:hypothetical protein
VASTSFLPDKDTALLAWSLNFQTLIVASPVLYGLTAALATTYSGYHTAFASALGACDPSVRSKSAVVAKNAARTSLKNNAKLMANLVNGTASVTNAQKVTLGIPPRALPSPVPAPSSAPNLDVVSVNGWTVRIKLHDSTSGSKRGKPAGVIGASVFSFVGIAPASDVSLYKFEGNTGKTTIDVVFPNTLAAGTQVWITAFWFNGRKQSGPACTPVGAFMQFGGISMAA